MAFLCAKQEARVLKPTLTNIAHIAEVGTATVERVLNGRGGVRPHIVEKVIAAARTLGYKKQLPSAHRGLIRIELILVRPETTFYARVSQACERIAATLDSSIQVQRTFLDEADPASIARHIANPPSRRQGLILSVPDHPKIRAAITIAQGQGAQVLQITTRAENVATDFVSIDNVSAGRTAARLMTGFLRRAGTIVAMGHSAAYSVHRDRIRGFSDFLAAHPQPDVNFVAMLFGHDEGPRSADLLSEALQLWPDLVGFYSTGGGNSSLSDVLRQHPRGKEVFFIGHELTERSSAALREGIMDIVLDQAPEAQAQRAIDLMLFRLGLIEKKIENSPIRFITVTADNI